MTNNYSDLSIKQGDLSVENGRLLTDSGEDAVSKSIARKLKTSVHTYRRQEIYNDELVLLDEDYGNVAYQVLSSPMESARSELSQALVTMLQQDTRITLQSIDIEPVNANELDVTIEYIVNSSSSNTSQTLSVTI